MSIDNKSNRYLKVKEGIRKRSRCWLKDFPKAKVNEKNVVKKYLILQTRNEKVKTRFSLDEKVWET